MDPTSKFATQFASTRFEHLSPHIFEAVQMTILDTAGAALAGSSSDPGRAIARIAQHYGGATGSTLLAHNTRVIAPMAALANGVMARCCELDGTHETGGGHVGVSIVPAALALVEVAPKPVSGRELAVGIALGVDMLCRLRMGAGCSMRSGSPTRRAVATSNRRPRGHGACGGQRAMRRPPASSAIDMAREG